MLRTKHHLTGILMNVRTACIAAAVACGSLLVAQTAIAAPLEIFNPDWSITLTDYGYSDLLFDQRPGFEGREYLSGEWGAAFDYSVGGVPKGSTWVQPDFIAPDWTTNSDFTVVTPMFGTGVFNASGFEKFESVVANAHLGIRMTYQFEDTLTGIEQGNAPASFGGPGASETSNRYVLRQTYEVLNHSGDQITDLQAFQFLHGLESTRAVYDDRTYGGPLGAYHYDVTERGLTFDGEFLHNDVLSMHSAMAPSAWEVGRYGIEGIDSHLIGKPSVGVHLSVEADALSGVDLFDLAVPPRWVSGAMRWDLPDLAHGHAYTYDVLLTISTVTVPEPGSISLAVCALAVCGMAALRKRYRR